uniref:Uncharacterized protein n=1 Tax=Candidatus Kentrum sp. SD TaxID=2126332 RepID=A0A450YHN0_9GAMM|nr:MAG: hypothetical protein BECKSD772F_GA0070984_10826 [Candidatus Kentron sp. SD]VFK46769.1 MAG: hypothetical protein BECKSD772E_GA0070983_10806 [Candidatus Kentron sp. SD]VFK81132.1 MAG: hypothetical protein BECKSD772D_GA0070982_12312 [Candidatus Kentron sp. SD]
MASAKQPLPGGLIPTFSEGMHILLVCIPHASARKQGEKEKKMKINVIIRK